MYLDQVLQEMYAKRTGQSYHAGAEAERMKDPAYAVAANYRKSVSGQAPPSLARASAAAARPAPATPTPAPAAAPASGLTAAKVLQYAQQDPNAKKEILNLVMQVLNAKRGMGL